MQVAFDDLKSQLPDCPLYVQIGKKTDSPSPPRGLSTAKPGTSSPGTAYLTASEALFSETAEADHEHSGGGRTPRRVSSRADGQDRRTLLSVQHPDHFSGYFLLPRNYRAARRRGHRRESPCARSAVSSGSFLGGHLDGVFDRRRRSLLRAIQARGQEPFSARGRVPLDGLCPRVGWLSISARSVADSGPFAGPEHNPAKRTACDWTPASPASRPRFRHGHRVLRVSFFCARLSHFSVWFLTAGAGRSEHRQQSGSIDLSRAAAGADLVAVHSGPRVYPRSVLDSVVAPERRGRGALAHAGRRKRAFLIEYRLRGGNVPTRPAEATCWSVSTWMDCRQSFPNPIR